MEKDTMNNEVDNWMEWLDQDDEKREDIILDSTKDDIIKKNILQNNLDEIADFLDINENKKKNIENEKVGKTKTAEKIVTLESTPLNSIKDCETLGEILANRIKNCKAKSVSIERFLSIIIQACESKLNDIELQSIGKKIQLLIENRQKGKRYALINKKKPNEIKNSIKNYKDEVDMIYGDISYDEEDYDDDDEADKYFEKL
ncbi:conserved Plasmodium protein, unknown function [Plasmodium gallinaceum]|uniref:Eukaryotic translation initiation factor 3 30 kDa subunit n=1 Tax=Plasmodium gallinaceum TaxID=5849 RepID=A0A1J1GMT7_PLAGA|nr:conserved Plasmodium protein, unknown function [Plasmodium gallinaceum]CRG93760.1 conserved Plasmodium protein, unknown function [Plasmodium gallinaceum]